MARLTIYVPDDMKKQMDDFDEKIAINWSNVAQQAFAVKIEQTKLPKETEMDRVIERLRASKIEHGAQMKKSGFDDGRHWAMNVATYPELKRMGELDISTFWNAGGQKGHAWEWLDFQMGVNIRENPETSFFWDGDVDRLVPQDDDYVEAFTEGAQQIWKEIAEKI